MWAGWTAPVRLWPHWEFRSFGHEIANPFFPGILIPGILFTAMYAWPQIDRLIYRDHEYHNLLDRPRDKPLRTAIGVAALAFFTDLTLASATDLLGNDLHIAFERLIEILQYGVFVAPLVAGVITYKTCIALQRTGTHVIMKPVGGILIRTADGAYHTLGDEHHGGDAHVDTNGGGDGYDLDEGHAVGNGHSGNGNGHSGNGNGNGHSDDHEAELEEPAVGGRPLPPGGEVG